MSKHARVIWSNSILPNKNPPYDCLKPHTLWVSARVKLSRPISMAFRAASPSWATGLRREDVRSWASYHSDGDSTMTLLAAREANLFSFRSLDAHKGSQGQHWGSRPSGSCLQQAFHHVLGLPCNEVLHDCANISVFEVCGSRIRNTGVVWQKKL